MPRLLTAGDSETGIFTVTSQADVTNEQLDDAITAIQAGEPTPGFKVLDVTPKASLGERAGRAVGRGMGAVKEALAKGAESPCSITTQTFGKDLGGKIGRGVAENLPLPVLLLADYCGASFEPVPISMVGTCSKGTPL